MTDNNLLCKHHSDFLNRIIELKEDAEKSDLKIEKVKEDSNKRIDKAKEDLNKKYDGMKTIMISGLVALCFNLLGVIILLMRIK